VTSKALSKSMITFDAPALQGWSFPVFDVVGKMPGPRLAVIAGVHVNETSSIEAAIRLRRAFNPDMLKGRVSIMPIVNLPAVPHRSQYVCPLDNKNINFSFPGRAGGTFSEAIADALLNWAADADCFVDMHGGDLCENVSHFTVCQTVGDPAFDQRNMEIARCFDAELIVRLDPTHLKAPGRSCTGRATRRQHAAFSEAGRIGIMEEANIEFHYEGVLRIAKYLGMIESAPPPRRAPQIVSRYLWLEAPKSAFYRYRVEAGQRVDKGCVLAIAENTFGEVIGEVTAPEAGFVLWRLTHALVEGQTHIMGLGVPD